MKQFLAIIPLLFDIVSATTFNINVQKDNDSIVIKNNEIVQKLNIGESVNLGTIGSGHWNGKVLSILSNQLSPDNLTISSRNIPISMNSLQIPKCDIYAPGLSILGNTKIDTFIAKIKNQKEHLLNVEGSLYTQSLTITGPTRINGTVKLKKNSSLTFKNPGFNTLIVNGNLTSEGTLHIQKENCSEASIINNGVISSISGVISCCIDEFTNESKGKICGEEARFYIGPNGVFQNHGTFEFKKLLFKAQSNF